MRGHELVALAVRQARTVLPVERTQLGGELPGRASPPSSVPIRSATWANRTGSSQTCGSSILTFLALAELEAVEQVDRRVAAFGGVLERGLEPLAQVEDEVGVAHLFDVPHGQLDIVRLRAGGREVRHLDAIAADLGCRERQGIEAGDDLGAAVGRARRIAAAAREEQDGRAATRMRTILVTTRIASIATWPKRRNRAQSTSSRGRSPPHAPARAGARRADGRARRRHRPAAPRPASLGRRELGLATVYRTLGLWPRPGWSTPSRTGPASSATAGAGRGPSPPRLLELPPRRRARRLRAGPLARADLRRRLRDHRPPPRGVRPLRRLPLAGPAPSRLRDRSWSASNSPRRRPSWAQSARP